MWRWTGEKGERGGGKDGEERKRKGRWRRRKGVCTEEPTARRRKGKKKKREVVPYPFLYTHERVSMLCQQQRNKKKERTLEGHPHFTSMTPSFLLFIHSFLLTCIPGSWRQTDKDNEVCLDWIGREENKGIGTMNCTPDSTLPRTIRKRLKTKKKNAHVHFFSFYCDPPMVLYVQVRVGCAQGSNLSPFEFCECPFVFSILILISY